MLRPIKLFGWLTLGVLSGACTDSADEVEVARARDGAPSVAPSVSAPAEGSGRAGDAGAPVASGSGTGTPSVDGAAPPSDAGSSVTADASLVTPLPALPYGSAALAVDGVSGAYDGVHDRTWVRAA